MPHFGSEISYSLSSYCFFGYSGRMPPTTAGDPQPEDFLPLHRDTFQILVSLADCDRHGYSILLDIAKRTGDARSISPSTLYSSIPPLLDSGLTEELHEPPTPAHDH